MDAESLSKLILDKVVNDLVKQKQSLPSGQLPRDTLTEVINSLREHNVHITHDALKQRVTRAYASARGPSTPLPPPPPATEVVTRGTATNTSPISQLTTPAASSTEGSSIATSSAQSTSTHPGPSATPYHTGGRPKGTTNANKKKQKDTLTDCRNAIAREYFNERKKSESTLKALPNNYLKNLIESKKVEYGIEGEVGINPKTIMRRYHRNAISERGWYPLSRALLDHPSLARPTTSEVTENDGTGSTTSATTTTTTTTAAGSRTVSININAGGQAARYLDTMLEEQRRNNRLDENVRRRRDGGTSARELLEKSRALTAGVVVATGNYSLNNKSLCEFVNDKHEKKMAEEARVLAYRKGKKRKQFQDVNDLRKTFGHESVHRFAQFNKDQCGKYLQYKKRKKDSKMPDDLEERRARCLEVMGRQSPVPSDDEEEQELIPPNNNPNAVTNNSTEENNVEAEGDNIFGSADDNLEAVKDAAI